MQSLDEIKRRIRSIQTTSKITGAMKLVATAKMKKVMNQFKKVNIFCQDFYNIIEELVQNVSPSTKNKNQTKGNLWILICSSLGLCGAFNINICKYLISKMQPSDKVIVIGRKGYAYLKSRDFGERIIEHVDFSDNVLDYFEVLPLSEEIITYFNNHEYDAVHLVYTKFVNSLTFTPTSIQLLPFDSSLFKHEDKPKGLKVNVDLNEQNKEIEYEPSKMDILKSSLSIFVTTSLYTAIYESRICENGSRRNAMETATDNARELIDELTLEFNEARQQNITQEINEIVAGADGSTL